MLGQCSNQQEQVGMTRRGSEEKAQPMHVVIGIVELFDFVETGSAVAGIDDEYMSGPAKSRAQARCIAVPVRWKNCALVVVVPVHRGVCVAHAPEAVDTAAQINIRAAVRRVESAGRAARSYRLRALRGQRRRAGQARDRSRRNLFDARVTTALDAGPQTADYPLAHGASRRLPVIFMHRKCEGRQNYRKILEGEVLGREPETVPVREGGRDDSISFDKTLFANADPVPGSSVWSFDPA